MYAVGQAYEVFADTPDEEVRALLERAAARRAASVTRRGGRSLHPSR
jgi:predicted phosphoribosyltransferase